MSNELILLGAGTAAGGVFTPPSGLIVNRNSRYGVAETGGAVTAWIDAEYATGFNLEQSSSPKQPTTGTRVIDSKNAIDFDGTNDKLFNVALANHLQLADNFTIFMVFKADTVNVFATMLGSATANNDRFSIGLNNTAGGNISVGSYNGAFVAKSAAFTDTTSAHIVMVTSTSSNVIYGELDGVAMAGATTPATSPNVQTAIGSRGDDVSPFDGLIPALQIYNRVLSAPEIAYVTANLNSEWGAY